MPNIITLYKSASRTTKLLSLAAVALVLVAGAYVIPRITASGFFAFLEPELGTVSGGASVVTDATASTGKAILFTTPPVTTPPTTPSTDGCPAFPAMPDSNCTGYKHTGVTLKDCPTTVDKPGTVLDSCRFNGDLSIQAANVTITRSLVRGLVAATYLTNWDLVNLKLQDVEIDGGYSNANPDPNGRAAIGYDNYTCIRCDVHSTGRGFNFANNVLIQDSYAHDFAYVEGAHESAAGNNGGAHSKVIHSNFDCAAGGCSGALVMYGDFDPIDDILIQNNLFNSNGSYCLYAGSTGTSSGKPYPHGTNVRIIDNLFGKKYYKQCGYYGPLAAWEANAGNVWSGNKWQDGSGTLTP